ncbi:MAG: hypothetical protein QG612_2638 [Pseudomonadota bacterium]|nr:hypothetical protein [Pseudomonadota bacterium]
MSTTPILTASGRLLTPQEAVVDTAFWQLLRQFSWAGAALHMLYIPLFLSFGTRTLAAVSVGSIGLLAVATVLQRIGRTQASFWVLLGDLAAHAIFGVWTLGWDSGLWWPLVGLLPAIILHTRLTEDIRWRAAVCVIACCVTMRLGSQLATPLHELPPVVLETLMQANLLMALAMLMLLAKVSRRLTDETTQQLSELLQRDGLTRLDNRRHWTLLAQQRLDVRPAPPDNDTDEPRPESLLTVAVADLDGFRVINERCGHEAADRSLAAIARVLRDNLRTTDLVGRWGDEEFIVMMNGLELPEAFERIEALRNRISQLSVPLAYGQLPVSVTLGLAEIAPGESLSAAILRAERALVEGKRAGGNRVVSAQPPTPTHTDRVADAAALSTQVDALGA